MIAVRLTASMVSNLDSGIDVPEDGSKRERGKVAKNAVAVGLMAPWKGSPGCVERFCDRARHPLGLMICVDLPQI